jgi:hypothetical protein
MVVPFRNPKKKTHKVHMNEGQSRDIYIMFIKIKKSISKRLLKIRSNFGPLKIHNYDLVNVIKKKFTFNFIIPLFKTILIIINNLD